MSDSTKDILLLLFGVLVLWWLEKQHQIQLMMMGNGLWQAPMYPNQPPTVRPCDGAPPNLVFAPTPEAQPPTWASSGSAWGAARSGSRANGGGGMKLLLQLGGDSYEFGPTNATGRPGWGGNYG